MNDPFGSVIDLVAGSVPADLCAGGAASGDYLSLKNWQGALVVLFKAAGTAGDDPTITLRQATAVAGTAVKDAAIITEYFVKTGALLTGVGTWTRVTQAAAATVAGSATSAEEQAMYVFKVEADQLDVDGGFDCIVANVADPGNAGTQYGCVFYIPYGPRYGARPDSLPNAIAD
jgi:hypothetical protein